MTSRTLSAAFFKQFESDSVELLDDDMFWTNLNDEIAEILRAHNKANQKFSSSMMQVIDNILGPVNSNS